MSIVSISTICHCTKFDSLKSIVKSHSFWCSYSNPEELTYINWCNALNQKDLDLRPLSFPMICFTDLAKDIRGQHKERYGGCLIELSEAWRDKSNLQPVWYLRGNKAIDGSDNRLCSSYLPNTIKFAYKFTEILKVMEVKNAEGYKNFLNLLICYFKMYQSADGYKYYDEREWRYVPLVPNGGSVCLTEEQYVDEHYRNLKIEMIRNSETGKLFFDWEDVISIEVKTEAERQEMVNIALSTFPTCEKSKISDKIRVRL